MCLCSSLEKWVRPWEEGDEFSAPAKLQTLASVNERKSMRGKMRGGEIEIYSNCTPRLLPI
jgi:hypothetical protein